MRMNQKKISNMTSQEIKKYTLPALMGKEDFSVFLQTVDKAHM